MIIDTLEHASRYEGLHPRFKAAFDFLRNTDLATWPEGRFELAGSRLFALTQAYETKPIEGAKLEAHRTYIDIQFVVSGEEAIGYAPLTAQAPVDPFNEEKDIGFYHGDASFTTLAAGMFAIFYPNDAHLPSRYLHAASPVKKIVIKVACEG
jgi:YhcH/YjgK/YiaL family protein